MLSAERNKLLTQVGAGTPMGELLRRYWHPIAAVAELDDKDVKPVRLMGEDLTLYKDKSGNYGLVDRHCPHRSADLSYGYTEECGLRCNYHGWLFDHTGKCLEQPYEDTAAPEARFKDKIKIKAYKVEVKGGLLWAYMGPDPAPLVPTWEPFTWTNGFVQIVYADIPCNWFQCQENSIDPVHFEWMHANWSKRLRGEEGPNAPAHTKVDFDDFEYGIIYRRVRTDTDEENELWKTGRVCLWPHALFTGHFEWRVPVDDENTFSITWHYARVPKDKEPFHQNRIPYWHGPILDEATGRWITSHVMNQDFVAWVGQGHTTDRTREHLGKSDRGIQIMRQRFFDDLKRVEEGKDPSGLIRDAEANKCIELPIVDKQAYYNGWSRDDTAIPSEQGAASNNGRSFVPRFYPFQSGQPEEIRRAYEDAMGFTSGPALQE